MASKIKGKEVESSGSGAGRKKTTVWNHDIEFKDAEQCDRYNTLFSIPISACRYHDSNAMITLGIRYNVVRLLNNLGWVEMLSVTPQFLILVY